MIDDSELIIMPLSNLKYGIAIQDLHMKLAERAYEIILASNKPREEKELAGLIMLAMRELTHKIKEFINQRRN